MRDPTRTFKNLLTMAAIVALIALSFGVAFSVIDSHENITEVASVLDAAEISIDGVIVADIEAPAPIAETLAALGIDNHEDFASVPTGAHIPVGSFTELTQPMIIASIESTAKGIPRITDRLLI